MRRATLDEGSVTVWTLGVVLIVMFVGAISFDLWSGFATRREYSGAADQAAQAGANALDESLFRSTGQRKLDPARAEQLAADNLAAQGLEQITGVAIDATTDEVVVELTTEVDVGLLRIFGGGDPLVVHVRAIGQPREVTP
ncbi:MAG: pilus assembly protein TadG-related protein [Ilumatobacteraceae bacterium]|nr:pilus assembly protein TadG-related protein [Ilumatobacteraceae bacterium]